MKIYKKIGIIIVSLFVATQAFAGVRFITDLGKDENFNNKFDNTFKSKCAGNYISCDAPRVGVGNACEGKYLKCECPKSYTSCEAPKVGDGTGCDGKYDPKDCKCPSENMTLCNGANNIINSGAQACDGKYKKEDCLCPSGWFDVKKCPSPMILSGKTCDSPGLVYTQYEKCSCPSNYVKCDNGKALGADGCTETDGTLKWTSCQEDLCPAGMVDIDEYWGGKLKYFMDLKTYTTVGSKRCVKLPACETFGYNFNSSTCSSQDFLKCPFDNNKVYCPEPAVSSCSTGGYLSEIPEGKTCTTVTYSGKTCYKDCKVNSCADHTKNAECFVCPKGDLQIAMDDCWPMVKDADYKCVYFPPRSECGAPVGQECAAQYFTPTYSNIIKCKKPLEIIDELCPIASEIKQWCHSRGYIGAQQCTIDQIREVCPCDPSYAKCL